MAKRIWRVHSVVGARPNFVKIAPIMRALRRHSNVEARLIHTGQHYDIAMNAAFFEELAIPAPDVNLEVGSGTNTAQTARIMLGLEPEFIARRPDIILVVGDVNSTMAAALVASKLHVPVVHVEAGLRSGDLTMPEEVNRLVTDRLSALLLTTEQVAGDNLQREGIAPERISFVGNVMIDTLHSCLERARPVAETLGETGATTDFAAAARNGFGYVTLHRPSNVDDPAQLRGLVEVLVDISGELPLIFPMHPRTKSKVDEADLTACLASGQIHMTQPLSYLRALGVMQAARVVITDSGGIQEETTALGVPCLTIRDNTERPITVDEGTNVLVGSSPVAVRPAFAEVMRTGGKRGRIPQLWDGHAADRVVAETLRFLEEARHLENPRRSAID